ncbi:MAG: endonuclease III [Chloroflexi bacterium]|nr:endonuclease III [Chloroflexota bacterium]
MPRSTGAIRSRRAPVVAGDHLAPAAPKDGKRPFDVDEIFERLRQAVRPFPKAALFDLADQGFGSPFEQLVACLISIRTKDEVTLLVAHRLFERARTPAELVALSVAEIDDLIRASTFHEVKAPQLHRIARRVVAEHGGGLPCTFEELTSFAGVGIKCANLVLGIACGQPRVGVDIHVHRVTNRWGYVQTKTPEQTTEALEAKLPRPYWIEINRLLVPFGKHVCTGTAPRCSTCPVLEMCQQQGVAAHR